MQLKSGALLQGGKYRIERFINSGGFGCTYEASHVMLHKRIAIKEFFVKDFCNRDNESGLITVGTQSKVALVKRLMEKFIEEAVSLSQMSHPNIVRVTDVFEENGTAYYVMDYIDGSSLDDIVKARGRLSENDAIGYIRQVAGALEHVHDKNRLHLDIKPGNIMVNVSGEAFLIDFGVSKQYDSVEGENTSTLLGKTPGYAPIEQMGNNVQQFTPATDIYALGATLYKLLSGVTPPESTLIIEDGIPELDASISEQTRTAINKAMSFRRKDRQQSVREFLSMLSSALKVKSEESVKDFSVPEVMKAVEYEHVDEETRIGDFKEGVVDLGLSVNWSSVNLGAARPWEKGKLIEWEEAEKSLKGSWRLPTEKEIDELVRQCKFIRDSKNGTEGYTVVGKNGNKMFLPSTGYSHGYIVEENAYNGYYWSGTLHHTYRTEAYYLFMTKDGLTTMYTRQYFGFAVRPVCPK